MAGGGKKQTVGYKIFVGMHMALCHGPIDKIIGIRIGEKQAWTGSSGGGRITINSENLFGGEEREGGVSGDVDFEQGENDQGQNDYLLLHQGALTPSYRKVAALVLRQCYVGMNPYLKPWAIKASRIHVRQDGVEQWYDERAEIPLVVPFTEPKRFYFALDATLSMNTVTSSGQTRFQVMKENMASLLNAFKFIIADSQVPVHMRIGTINSVGGFQTFERSDLDDGKIDEIIAFINGLSAGNGTEFTSAMTDAASYFSTPLTFTPGPGEDVETVTSFEFANTLIAVTDGEPAPASEFPNSVAAAEDMLNSNAPYTGTNTVDMYVVNIDLEDTTYSTQLDNTPSDGVPVIDGSSVSALYDAIFSTISGGAPTMNPIHIIRECLTDTDWGMGEPEADIDDTNFRAAADQLYLEGFGLCLHWTKQVTIEEFIYEVSRHINAVVDVNPSTGLWEIYLIRNTYNPADLVTLDASNIRRVSSFERPEYGELVNSVTVKYSDAFTEQGAAVTVQDTAMIEMQGATINTKVEYPGIASPVIAQRAAYSSLESLSQPLASCTIEANREAAALRVGYPFKLTWPKYGLNETVMRVTEISYGDGAKTRVRIKCVEDAFSLPEVSIVNQSESLWVNPVSGPTVPSRQMLFEAPYFELVQQLGEATANSELAELPDLAYVGAAVGRSDQTTLYARLLTSTGGAYEDQAAADFCTTAELAGNIDYLTTQIFINNITDYSRLEAGVWAQINNELVYIESVSDTYVTVKRGVLDTHPAQHTAGDIMFVWDSYSGIDPTQYVDGQTISAKLLPTTGSAKLDEGQAPVLTLEMEGRAIRPFPPANVQIDAAYHPTTFTSDLVFTWAHRDRLQQTTPTLAGWTEGNIGPETGVTYRFRIYDDVGALHTEVLDIAGTTYTYVLDSMVGGVTYTFELTAHRDGYESYQPFTIDLLYDVPPPVQVSEVNSAIFVKPSDVSVQVSEVNSAIFVKAQ